MFLELRERPLSQIHTKLDGTYPNIDRQKKLIWTFTANLAAYWSGLVHRRNTALDIYMFGYHAEDTSNLRNNIAQIAICPRYAARTR
jgi:hypothetical protein